MAEIRTDLAVELKEMYREKYKKELDGVIAEEKTSENIKITKVTVKNEEGAKAIGKPKGVYITLDLPELNQFDGDIMDEAAHQLAESLKEIITVEKDKAILVVGLGNSEITPDALGPKVVSKLMITRHLTKMMPGSIDESINSVCSLAPGVLGTTGIETLEIIKGLVDRIKPQLVICVDALASRKMERLNRTIQIGNTGIAPGAGVGNKRKEINLNSLGVPVIAIGVPTVVDAATIANDTLDLFLKEINKYATEESSLFKMLSSVDGRQREGMIREILNPYVGDLMVTPKDVDAHIEGISKIISTGINLCLQPAFNIEDINKFLN